MRLLYVTNGFPFPLTTGYLRHYHLLHHLGRSHDIALLSLVRSPVPDEHRAELEPAVSEVHVFGETGPSARASTVRRGVRAIRRAVASTSSPGAVALGRTIERLRADADAILVSGKRSAEALRAAGDLPLVIDICDATSSRLRGAIRHERPLRALASAVELVSVVRAERDLVRRGDHLLFASDRDRDLILGTGGAGTSVAHTVVPNGVDLEFWRRGAPGRGDRTVVFTGKMDFPPNEDAALRLCRTIFPAVRARVPEAQLLIVGRDPTPRLLAAGAGAGITVTGPVDDVRPYLDAATVFAAPLRFGAGIQNKLLEALAMELPVVTSPTAAAGLHRDGSAPPVDVADDDAAFVDRLVAHLRSEERDPRRDARAFVSTNFDWSRSAELVEAAFRDVTARAAR
jgi:glycosyltransferase involved in cell wall biosynthesis